MLFPEMSRREIVFLGVPEPSRLRTIEVGESELTIPMTSTIELAGESLRELIGTKWKVWEGIVRSSFKT